MADPKDIQLQPDQLKQIETILASTEQRMQRLAILQKSIDLKLIDPKQVQNFDTFLKKLATADIKNIENLRNYITGASNQFDELIQHSKQFANQSDNTNKILISQNQQLEIIASKFDKVKTSATNAKNATKGIGDELNDVNQLVTDFVSGLNDSNDEFNKLDNVQAAITDSFKKMTKEQKKQLALSIGTSNSYDEFSDNIGEILKNLEGAKSPLGNLFNINIGNLESMVDAANATLSGIGQGTFTFDGNEISEKYRGTVLKGMVEAGQQTIATIQTHIQTAKKSIEDITGIAGDVVDLMVKDIVRKTTGMGPELSTDEMLKVSDAWKIIDSNANPALKVMIAQTADATMETQGYVSALNGLKGAIPIIDNLSKKFGMLNRFSEQMLSSLEFATWDIMPNWLYQTLGLDSAFEKISETARTGLAEAATNIANGAKPAAELAKFAGKFNLSMIGALGTITLLTAAITGLYSLMQHVREQTGEYAKELGISKSQAKGLYKDTLSIVTATDNLYVKQEDVLAVLKKHKEEYGFIMDLNSKASQDAIKFSAALGKQYGLGAEEIYGFTSQLQNLGADQATAEGLAAWASNASELAGIPFTNITKDLAESAEFVALHFAKMPEQALKATIKLRAMGSSLKQVEKAMDKAFDMSSFLQGMTELNIMTQGVVDLSKYFNLATSLAPVEDQAAEINKQFDKLMASGQANYFTMKQFADTVGMSVEELQRGNKIRKMEGKLSEEQLDLLTKYSDKLTEAELTDAKLAALATEKLSANEKLDATWESIKATLVQALLPAVEALSGMLSALAPLLKVIGVILKGFAAPLTAVGDIINGITKMISGEGFTAFEGVRSMFGDWSSGLKVAGNLASIFIGIWAGSKLLGPLKGITKIFTGWGSTLGTLGTSIKKMFSGGGSVAKGSIFSKMFGGLKKMFTGGPQAKGTFFSRMFSGITKYLPKKLQDVISKVTLGQADALDPAALTLTDSAAALIEAAEALKSAASNNTISDTIENVAQDLTTPNTPTVDIPTETKPGGKKGGTKKPGGASTRTSPQRYARGRSIRTTPTIEPPAVPKGRWGKLTQNLSKFGNSLKNINFDTIKSVASKGGDVLKTGASKAGNLLKGALPSAGNLLKSAGPAILGTVAGMGANYYGDKKIQEGLETGDRDKVDTGRLAKTGARALEFAGYGATAGTLLAPIAPGISTAVGAAVGGVIGGAVGTWENYFSDDAKAQDALLNEAKKTNELTAISNSVLKGISDEQLEQLKQAGYSEDILKGLSEGSLSLEDAIKQQYKDANFSDEQLKVITNPDSDPMDVQKAMNAAMGVGQQMPTPSLAVGTDLVKKDGLAMLHQGEAVVPAEVAKGGFTNSMSAKTFGNFMPELVDVLGNKKQTLTANEIPSVQAKPINAAPQVSMPEISAEAKESVNNITNNYTTNQPAASNNSDAMLKQISRMIEAYANRPVVVQVGGTELRSLNKSLKVYNNT